MSATWVYVRSEPQLWTVGFYDPEGKWHPDADYNSSEKAAERVHYLNGGNNSIELCPSCGKPKGRCACEPICPKTHKTW